MKTMTTVKLTKEDLIKHFKERTGLNIIAVNELSHKDGDMYGRESWSVFDGIELVIESEVMIK